MDGEITKELKIATIIDSHNAYQDLATENFNCRLAVGVLHHRESNGAYLWYGEQYNGVEVKEPVAFERKARSEILTPEDNDTEGNGLQYTESDRTVRFTVNELQAGGKLTVGVIVRTPSVEPNQRKDFYNYILGEGADNIALHKVTYEYTGEVPDGADELNDLIERLCS